MRSTMLVAAIAVALILSVPTAAQAGPTKKNAPRGDVPAKWDLAKPDAVAHPDARPASAGGNGDGKNTISFGSFDDGDLIVVLGTATGHAGLWDDAYHVSDSSACVWSANTTPGNDVLREQAIKYRAYDQAYGLWVPSVSTTARVKARSYCRSQNNEPYDISSAKSDQSRWYCSKLGWAAYRYTAGVDLDGDGGYWVWPVDLINDPATSLFAKSL